MGGWRGCWPGWWRQSAMSDLAKITDAHRRRRAVVYVRQSTPAQLERNHESRARQYALRERAVELGWPAGAVTVVDDDLGRSGASTEGRLGFRELVAEVGLGQVGLILSLESSRLARSSADWHQLLDLCALTGTLIADSDGIYSPQDFNDRLLLGLKGTMSEAELHLIRARLNGGLRNKANRGELALNLPVGLDRDEDGRIVLAANEQVRHAIGRVFELWRQLSSARQIDGELRAEGQQLPRRTVGSRRVRWQPATYGAVHDFLTNPVYAGAFVFGRSRTEKRLDATGKVRTKTITLPLEQWSVCLPEHHPGYVSWPDYLQTRERLRADVILPGEGSGASREGDALLQGLLRCGRCGRRMQVTYSGNSGRIVRYSCVRAHQLHGAGHACQSVGGHRLEQAVTAAFLDAVTPAGLRVSADAIEELNQQHDARMHGQRLAAERAEYEAERARRQFDACEPEHRLVARTLEARLESTLSDLERERRRLAELEQRRPQPLTPDERRALTRVARNLPRLWNAPSTSSHDRKALLRCLLIDVIVTIRDEPRQAELELQWEGGAHTELTVALIHRGPESKRTDEPGFRSSRAHVGDFAA